MTNEKRLGYFSEGLIPFIEMENADFRIILGDIADNYLDILNKEINVSSQIGNPGYYVFGNHDINYRAKGNRYSAASFKRVYGPEYFSFDVGKFHYIVLKNIIYEGWNFEENKRGSYFGGIDDQQLQWLKSDVEHIAKDKTIVVCTHAPLLEKYTKKNVVEEVFKILGGNHKIFAVSGHLHAVQAYDFKPTDSEHEVDGLVAGATCGAWWIPPYDENDIPYATSTDGTPKGYFVLKVDNKKYSYNFKPVNYPSNFNMRIYSQKDSLLVNWFVGKKTDEVTGYIKDLNIEIPFKNISGEDPFMRKTLNERKEKYPNEWSPGISKTNHLWEAKLPKGLREGKKYGLEIRAKDYKGKTYKGFKIIEVK